MNTRVLEYYSVIDSHAVDTSMYISKLLAAEEEHEDLIEVLVWQCAGNVLQVMEEADLSKRAFEKVEQFVIANSI